MTFLHAGLLGLGALFVVPLVIHLLNRRRYRRVQWAAMDFLLRAFRQNRRRLRLESLLLLLLRCAIPVLLALAIARPRVSGFVPPSNQGPHHIFVLDLSYSMGYRDTSGNRPFDRMKRVVTALVDRVARQSNEKVSLVYMGVDVSTPVRGDLDVTKAQRALARLDGPSDGRADLRSALATAAKLAAEEPDPPRIYVFSDFQKLTLESEAQASTKRPAGTEAPDSFESVRDACQDLADLGAEILLFPVAPRGPTSNTQIVALHLDPENAIARVDSTLRAELVHRGPEVKDVLVKLRIDGANEQARHVRLRPEEPQEAGFRVRFLDEGMHSVVLSIDEDGLPVDDTRRLVTRVRDQIHVLLVEGRDTADEEEILTNSFLYRYILDPAQGEGGDELRVFATRVVDEDRFQADPSFFQNQDVIALLDVSGPRPDVARRLVGFVERGGGLLVAPGPDSLPDLYNSRLFGVNGEAGPLPLRLLEIGGFKGFLGTGKGAQIPTSYATPKVALPDHPLLADFRAQELRAFLEVMPVYRYWTTSRVDKPKDTDIPLELAGSQDVDRPALIALRRFGQGECLLLASNLSRRPDRWNRLDVPDQISFPLLHSIAHYLAREPKDSLNRLVGESLATWIGDRPSALYMTPPGDRGRVPLRLPKARPARAGPGTAGWSTPPFVDTVAAGLYRLGVEFVEKTKAAREILFAVNPDAREGVLDYVAADALARELPAVDVHEGGVPVEIGSAIEANTSELGRWFLLLALVAALAESVVASFVGGRRR